MEEDKKLTKKEKYALKRDKKDQEKMAAAKSRKAKKILLWGTTLVIIAGSLFGIVKLAEKQAPDLASIKLSDQITAEDHVAGLRDAKVSLVEYGDFQCPACATYEPMLQQLRKDYPETVALVFRHFPLRAIHKNAQLASQAAVAAEKQGKFWDMHDFIYESQDEWAASSNAGGIFLKHAQEIGLDAEKFKADMDSAEAEERVEVDYQSGLRAGVSGTPTFFLNGEKIANPKNYEELKALIDAKINQ